VNLPLSKFRQDQVPKGAVQSLFIPIKSPALDLLCRIVHRHTHVGLETFVSNRAVLYARSAEEGQFKPPS
jgi:hypothetical protein